MTEHDAALNTALDPDGRLISSARISRLAPNEIFVFGSNAEGRHGGGAARFAMDRFGAVWGQGHGPQGQSYAVDTMSGTDAMAADIAKFLDYAARHPKQVFLVTELGCGIAGYRPADVAPLLAAAPANVALPASFLDVLPAEQPAAQPEAAQQAAPTPERWRARPGDTRLGALQMDRAVGAIVASAVGDALGAPYEFGPSHPDEWTPAFGAGSFGHEPGEWTDDTSMAVPILEIIADGRSLRDSDSLAYIARSWQDWSLTALDVGVQTRAVLSALPPDEEAVTEESMREQALAVYEQTGRSAGNGSLMRTGPIALAYLRRGGEKRLVEAAGRVAQLTHWEDDNVDAVALWSLAIRHAVLTGELDPRVGLPWIPEERRARWAAFIDDATQPGRHPRDFQEKNGWVVMAFQAALAAVVGATSIRDALFRAVRGGADTDTVAAIAGSLAGAVWGGSQVPLSWQRKLHGWPGYDVNDLTRLAVLAARRGEVDDVGWPEADSIPTGGFLHTSPVQHPDDAGLWLGSQSALGELPSAVRAVVSLSRVGRREIPEGVESVRVWLIDQPGLNADPVFTLADAADAVAELRSEGKQVFLHCAEARSRTAAVAALYAMRHRGVPADQAWTDVESVLPHFNPASFHREAVARIMAGA